MQLKNYFQRNRVLGISLVASMLMLMSCGSYEYVPYTDGIYSNEANQSIPEKQVNTTVKESGGYYSNYFSE